MQGAFDILLKLGPRAVAHPKARASWAPKVIGTLDTRVPKHEWPAILPKQGWTSRGRAGEPENTRDGVRIRASEHPHAGRWAFWARAKRSECLPVAPHENCGLMATHSIAFRAPRVAYGYDCHH